MISNKLDILKDLFLGFGRDPHVNKGIFDHYLSKSSETEPWILRKAVDELLSSCQSLPRVTDLLNTIKRYTPVSTRESTSCHMCGMLGLIYNVFCFKENGARMEVMSMTHQVVEGANYKSIIIGRCKCPNGEEYANSSHTGLSTPVDPPSYLINPAKKNGWDSSFQAGVFANKLNRGANSFEESVSPLVDTLNNLGLNTFVLGKPEDIDKLPKDLLKKNDES